MAKGTGAADLASVQMADEDLDLAEIETAVRAVRGLPGNPPPTMVTRGQGLSPAWLAGQNHLATLSTHVQRRTATGSGHQIPTEAPDVVAAEVDALIL